MHNKGWVKLHRKFLKWGWYQKSEMVHLFLHLILSANHEDREWQGITIKKGQLLTGRKKLKASTGISEQTIKTCLTRLKSTNEITTKSTNRYTIITIVNWGDYQDRDKILTNELTSKLNNNQPTTNQQLTTNKNVKNIKNVKKKSEPEKINYCPEDMKLTELLISLIKENNPDWQMRGNKNTWAENIEKLHRIDKRSYEDIEIMIRWIQADDFWKQNILSTAKVRDKFNDLIPKVRGAYQKKGTNKKIFI